MFRHPMSAKRFKKIYVEISNVCNLQCDFCPEVERDKKIMGEELFTKIISESTSLAEEVCFHLMGDPLTHPKLSRFVDICAEHQLPINLTTNGLLLDEVRTKALLQPIVRQVNFSVHSFEANFPGQDLAPYLDKIFGFTRRAMKERPDLYINYRLWNLKGGESIGETTRIVFKNLEKEFDVSLNRSVNVAWKKSKKVVGRLYLHFDSRFEWPSLQGPVLSDSGFCYGMSSHMAIHADGTVVPCCLDKEASVNLGSCREKGINQIIDSERATRIREGFSANRLVEDLCQRCSFIHRFN